MPLESYKRKRDFGKTPEPAGAPGSAPGTVGGGRFTVQRHRATRLHYDFRLEIAGILVSWAVPKGPTLDPGVRRMAVHVEDHPIEYVDFEGVIPARQYGAGDVIVWDWGTWQPEAETPDPVEAVRDGELKFRLDGQKLHGQFTIVRTSRRPGSQPSQAFEDDTGEQWLLIKKRDDAARAGWDAEQLPQSVKTGRTNDEVARNKDAMWLSDAPAPRAEIDLRPAPPARPGYVEPMLASLTSRPFDHHDWLFEIKWDGFRVEAVVQDERVRIFTRNGHDAATYFPRLLGPPGTWIDAREAVIDGEVVALDADGRPDFSLLQQRISESGARVPGGRHGSRRQGAARDPNDDDERHAPLVYMAFDLLHLDGRSLLRLPLEDRKALLRMVLRESPRVRLATHVEADGVAFYRAAEAQRLEGIVAKHRRSPYEPGRRASTWLKIKLRPEQELVVGGWTPGEGNAKELGAVIVGVYEGDRLRYAGKVGSGFDGRARRAIRDRLDALASDRPPFEPAPERRGELRTARWIRPELVIRAELGGWSRDGLVRQAAFKGIEPDREPRSVTRERAVDVRTAEADAESVVERAGTDARQAGQTDGAHGGHAGMDTSAADEAAGSNGGTSRRGRRSRRDSSGARPVERPAQQPPAFAPATPGELEALAGLGSEGVWRVGDEELKLTNLDKILFPPHPTEPDAQPIAKRELVAYFARIAPAMLPHLADRPLNLHRYPNGAGAKGFWQKDIPESAPGWLRRWREVGVEAREANDHLVADRTASLCWLGNQASFEVHAWTSRLENPMEPTFALIDIDPGERTTWDETLTLARLFRTALGHLGVRGYPKLTGKRGIQIWIPIVAGYTYEDTSAWVEAVSRTVGRIVPDLVSWEWSVKDRKGRARLDYTQNTYIKTLVAPYAVRPAAGAPVSAPIRWDELDDPDLRPDRWTIRTIVDRVAELGDLFASAQTDLQELPALR